MKNLVWIASYPRSGNTWFRLVLSCLVEGNRRFDINQSGSDLIANSRIMFDELSGIHSSELSVEEINNLRPVVFRLLSSQYGSRVYLKTHDQYFYTGKGEPVFPDICSYGCVYIIRNPLDVAVSNAFFFGRKMDDVLREMNDPSYVMHASVNNLIPVLEERIGAWSSHVTSWLNSGLRVHVVRYEDMLSNPRETIFQALGFLQRSFAVEMIDRAISETSFESLKTAEAQFGFRDKRQLAQAFFRNGKAGTWKSTLNDSQIEKMIADHHDMMARFGYLNEQHQP